MNIFSNYFEYKINVMYNYSILLSKIIGIDKNKLWKRRRETEDSLKWIVRDYINSYVNTSINSYLNRMFIDDKDIPKYKIDRELASVINYFIHKEKALNIKAYEKEIILVAAIINIANVLDVSTSPYKNNKTNYKTIVMNLIEKYNKIPYFNLIDNGKKITNELIELVKKNVKKERKIFDTLNSKTSFNKYIDISLDNRYYLSQYNYSLVDTKGIDELALKYMYHEKNIDNEFVLISKDIILVTLMKLLSVRKLRNIFLLPTKKDFYLDDKNVKNIISVFKDNISKRYLKVLINYQDFDDNLKNIINKYHIDYYLYCSRSTEFSMDKIEASNYLFSREFSENNNELYNKLLEKDKNVIIERFEGIRLDSDLMKESEV